MQVREHDEIRAKQKYQPFYYSRWYCCLNADCRTTMVMPEEFIVFRDDKARTKFVNYRLIKQQLTPRV